MRHQSRRPQTAINSMLEHGAGIPVAVQKEFAHQVDFVSNLAQNRSLDSDVWDVLMAKKHDDATAQRLVGRPLTRPQRLKVMRSDRRQGVLTILARYNQPKNLADVDDMTSLIRRPDVLHQVYMLVRSRSSLADAIGPHLDGYAQIGWLGDTKRPDPNVMVSAIRQALSTKINPYYVQFALTRVFDMHASLIAPVLAQLSNLTVLEAIASSINVTEDQQAVLLGVDPKDLRDPQALAQNKITVYRTIIDALVRNPVTTPRVLLAMEKGLLSGSPGRRNLKRRMRLNPPPVAPGLRDLDAKAVKLLLSLFGTQDLLSVSRWYRSNRLVWLSAMIQHAPAECQSEFLLYLHETEIVSALGPVRAFALRKTFAKNHPELVRNNPLPAPEWSPWWYPRFPTEEKSTSLAMRQRVGSRPASKRIDSHETAAGVALLVSEFGASPEMWRTFAELSESSGDAPITEVIGTTKRLLLN